MENNFEFVDVKKYVNELKKNGARIVIAEKTGSVIARVAKNDESLEVWTQNGNFEGAEEVKKGEVILTRVDKEGKPVVDEYGHMNSWKVTKETFEKKYDTEHPDPETGVFKPAGGKQEFMEIDRNISFVAPWKEQQNIVAGGFLNITVPSDIYGIAKEEFEETYEILKERTQK